MIEYFTYEVECYDAPSANLFAHLVGVAYPGVGASVEITGPEVKFAFVSGSRGEDPMTFLNYVSNLALAHRYAEPQRVARANLAFTQQVLAFQRAAAKWEVR